MTPQPQPAAYWIELLEELTGGIPFRTVPCFSKPTQLGFYFMLYTDHWDRGFYDCIRQEIDYIQSGQNIIDAAVEFLKAHNDWEKGLIIQDYNAHKYITSKCNMHKQTSLYLRCNGIKR